jgi:hypothetical protein
VEAALITISAGGSTVMKTLFVFVQPAQVAITKSAPQVDQTSGLVSASATFHEVLANHESW